MAEMLGNEYGPRKLLEDIYANPEEAMSFRGNLGLRMVLPMLQSLSTRIEGARNPAFTAENGG